MCVCVCVCVCGLVGCDCGTVRVLWGRSMVGFDYGVVPVKWSVSVCYGESVVRWECGRVGG